MVQAMNGMLPDAKKQLSEPLFTYIQQKPKETIPVVCFCVFVANGNEYIQY